jgi:large subunit ribosomal protein L35
MPRNLDENCGLRGGSASIGAMPKVKTHSGAKKRFKITAKGKVRGRHAMRSHILGKKNSKRRRRLDEPKIMSDSDRVKIKTLLRK